VGKALNLRAPPVAGVALAELL